MRSGTREIAEVTTTFGVSGYLRESDVIIYDRASQTLWQQIGGRGIAGPRAGTSLEPVAITDTTWAEWTRSHPATKVLRGPRPARAYARRRGYERYHAGDRIMFPLENRSDRLRPKAVVTGIQLGDEAACWSHERLAAQAAERGGDAAQEPLVLDAEVGGERLRLTYDPRGDSLTAARPPRKPGQRAEDGEEGAAGDRVATLRMYWFAWYTFHPRTTVDEAEERE